MFKRQFRLCREDFTDLLSKMINKYPGKSNNGLENLDYSYEMGRRSSGTCVPLEIKLYITLRILAGASYLDMICYGVAIESVH